MQPDLSKVKKGIEESRDLIDRISSKIPGFSGMLEKAESYAADQLVRDFMADKLQEMKGGLSELSGRLTREKAYDQVGEVESLATKLEGLYKKTKFADYASSVSASGIKVSGKERERLLEYDWRLLGDLDGFDEVFGRLRGAGKDEISGILGELRGKIGDYEKSFDDRKNALMEVL